MTTPCARADVLAFRLRLSFRNTVGVLPFFGDEREVMHLSTVSMAVRAGDYRRAESVAFEKYAHTLVARPNVLPRGSEGTRRGLGKNLGKNCFVTWSFTGAIFDLPWSARPPILAHPRFRKYVLPGFGYVPCVFKSLILKQSARVTVGRPRDAAACIYLIVIYWG